MTPLDDEAHLEKSKMSFGEHLEELRSAVVKSLLALLVGFLVGLLVGRQVVNYVQGPLREALDAHYTRQLMLQEQTRLEALKAAGEPVPENIEKAAESFADQRLVPHDMYVEPAAILSALKEKDPELPELPAANGSAESSQGQAAQAPAPRSRDDMLKLQVFQPLAEDPRLRIVGLGVEEPFVVYIKASLATGVVLASPFVFYNLWHFIAAGLYRKERGYVYTYLPISIGLFLAGATMAFFVAFKYMLQFCFWFYEQTGVDPDPRLSYWLTLVLMLPLAFGVAFQLPLIMLAIERIGIVTIETYTKQWKLAIVIICAISMFLTPPDPQSMILMATPLCGLYFGGILLCKYMPGQSLAAPPKRE